MVLIEILVKGIENKLHFSLQQLGAVFRLFFFISFRGVFLHLNLVSSNLHLKFERLTKSEEK